MGTISMTFPPSAGGGTTTGGWPTSGAYQEISSSLYIIQPTDATLVNIHPGTASFSTWDIPALTLAALTTNKIFAITIADSCCDVQLSSGGATFDGAAHIFLTRATGAPYAVILQYNNNPANPNFVILSQSIF